VLEADESYFGPQRVRGRCGRGAGGKTIVFGLFKRGDTVYCHCQLKIPQFVSR
jgi:hypothetical protein